MSPSSAPESSSGSTSAAATILVSQILLLDDAQTRVGALRIEDGVITHVLAEDDPALEGERVLLPDAFVIPGLVDAHLHLRGIGRAQRNVDLIGTSHAAEVIERVVRAAATTPAGHWIEGRGWDQNDWPEQTFPSHAALTAAVPDHPVILRRVDGHAIWVNARAMQLASIGPETQAPAGGEVLRDDDGAPTGVFVDNAIDLLVGQLPAVSASQIREDLALAMRLCADAGLTGVHDMGVDAATLRELIALENADEMPIRVTVYLEGSSEDTDALLDRAPDREGLLTVDGVKHYIDGALGSRGAALFEDYSDREGHRGLLVQSAEELMARARRAHAAGYRIAIHAIGDRGISTALDAIAAAQGDDRSPRHRVEHVQIIRPSDLSRLDTLGVTASMQPTHATSDMPWAETRVGPLRIEGAYAWRSMLDANVTLAFGSDAPVERYEPALGLYAAITRQDAAGEPAGGWTPTQRLSALEALRAFSAGAARAIERDDLGVIRVGARADLTVLDLDPLTSSAPQIRQFGVVATFVDGALRRQPRP